SGSARLFQRACVVTPRTGRVRNSRRAPMAIALEGTFDYVFDVDADLASGGRIKGRLRDPLKRGERRLVGQAPVLEAVEYQREAWQLYARIAVAAADR